MTIRLLSILSCIFLMLSCDDEQSEIKKFGKAKLSINTMGNANTGRTNSNNLDKIKNIVVSIETAGGTSVHDMQTFELIRFNDSFVSQELELEAGAYNVTKFFVTDADQNVLYATPLENSPLASLVTNPLPVSFVVNADGATTEVFMEAVNVAETSPEDFGYATFLLGLIDYKSFEVNATVADEDYTGSVNGLFEAFAKNAQGQIVWSKSWNIAEKIDIAVPIAERYSFKLTKAGHIPHEQHYKFEMLKQATKLSFELIPEDSDDFIVKQFPGKATVYFPADKGKLYTRIDLLEDYALKVDVIDLDRHVNNLTGEHPAGYFYALVTFVNNPLEGENNSSLFVDRAVNLLGNKPFVDAYDLRNIPLSSSESYFFEEFDRDAKVDSVIMMYELTNNKNEGHYQVWPFKPDFLSYWCSKVSSNQCASLTNKVNQFNFYYNNQETLADQNSRRIGTQHHRVAY